MGLAHRVIPTILCRGRVQVKGERFNGWREVGHVEQAMQVHAGREVDEVVLLDIAASAEGRGPDVELVKAISGVLYSPLAVGGGIRTLEHAQALLRAGADKLVMGEAANNLYDMKRISDAVGRQAVVAAIDVGADGWSRTRNGTYPWTDAVSAAALAETFGAGEILLTSIPREGTMAGYDIELIRRVRQAVNVPLVAHGGCAGYHDMLLAIQAGANAVAAGALFQFTEATPREAAIYLARNGIETRVPA